MRRRDRRTDGIKEVEREYRVAVLALSLLDKNLRHDPSYLEGHRVDRRDYRNLSRRLETTYLIRMFAAFESVLRQYRSEVLGKANLLRTRDLMRSVSAGKLPDETYEAADRVRKYRNSIVHGISDGNPEVVSLSDAERALSRFLNGLGDQ